MVARFRGYSRPIVPLRWPFCNLLLELQKPPAPVALEGRLCQSAKPHEYKRSLVWLNLPYPTNWEEPKVRRPPLSISYSPSNILGTHIYYYSY